MRHMWDEVDVAKDPEGHLLELSTGMDISGRAHRGYPLRPAAEVLARHPRLEIAKEFAACVTDQGTRKPASLAGGFVRAGITDRIAANPLDA